jgi:hypothetical protein
MDVQQRARTEGWIVTLSEGLREGHGDAPGKERASRRLNTVTVQKKGEGKGSYCGL